MKKYLNIIYGFLNEILPLQTNKRKNVKNKIHFIKIYIWNKAFFLLDSFSNILNILSIRIENRSSKHKCGYLIL